MEENINIFALVLDELNKNDMWFTTKADPTAEEASSYYKLDEYGEPTEATVKKIEKEVNSLIGDGAVYIEDAVELWVNDALVDCKIDYKDNLVTQFEDKPVVDNIEAYENPVQFPQSKKTEAKTKKTEGAGAGYEIRGTVLSAKVNNFEIIGNTTNQYNEKMYELKCDIDVRLEDVQFESYDYGGKIDFPIDGKVTYLIVSENGNNDVEGDLTNSDIESALDGAKIKEMLGGGWVHETFTGEFSGEFDGDLYGDYYALDYEMTLTQDTVVDFIDKKVDGVIDEVTYCVYDREGDPVDDFTDKDEAIEFAKKNDCIEVVEKYHDYELVDAEGSVDDNSYEDGDVVWEREYTKQYKFDSEVEESKKVVEAKELKFKVNDIVEDKTGVGKIMEIDPEHPEGLIYGVQFSNVDLPDDKDDIGLWWCKEGDISLVTDKANIDKYNKWFNTEYNKLESKKAERKKKQIEAFKNRFKKTEAKEDLKFKVGDIVKDKKGLGKVLEIEPDQPEKLIYGVLFMDNDLPEDNDDIGNWWCKENDITLVTDEKEKAKYNKWYNNYMKKENVNFNKRTKEKVKENYQRRLDEVNNKSKNLISDLFSSNDFDSDSPAGQIVMRTSEMFNALSDKGYDVEVTFDNGESTSAIQLGQQGGKVMITITNTNQPLRAFTSGNFEINDENIKILQDIQSQIEVL